MAHSRYGNEDRRARSPESDSDQTSGYERFGLNERIRRLECRIAILSNMVRRFVPRRPMAPTTSAIPMPIPPPPPAWNPLEFEIYQHTLTANYARRLELQHQRDEQHKIRLFLQGLRPELRDRLSTRQFATFGDCIQRCLSVEADMVQESVRQNAALGERRKRPRTEEEFSNPRTEARRPELPACLFCGEPHYAYVCPHRHGRCYGCGQLGHQRSECPLKTSSGTSFASITTAPGQPSVGLPDTATTGQAACPHQTKQWDAPESSVGRNWTRDRTSPY